jgi:hypothetical protein
VAHPDSHSVACLIGKIGEEIRLVVDAERGMPVLPAGGTVDLPPS